VSADHPSSVEDLEREAKRLRFTDAALEERYREERIASGLLRARVMAVVAMFYTGLIGVSIARRALPFGVWPEYLQWELTLRFLVVVPAWLLLYVSTFLRGHRRWAGWLYTGVTGWACAALLLLWCEHIVGHMQPSSVLQNALVDFVMVLLISAVALAMRWVEVALASAASTPVLAWLCWRIEPKALVLAQSFTAGLIATGAMIAVFAWLRERSDRLLFAQRISLARLNAELEKSRGELARANADLGRVNAEQNAFMGIAAHDLRAPLATVRGYAELLRAGRLRDEAAKDKALGEIEGQSARMLTLVSDYLGAHAAAGRAEPARVERVDVAASARAASARHAVAAAGKGQRIELVERAAEHGVAGAEEEIWARADEGRLAQVVDNFVVNALKFSPAGAMVKLAVGKRRGEKGQRGTAGGGWVRLAVSDAGPGIAAEERAELFRMFGRGSARPTGGEASHGLGLAVAKRLAESMGGTVGCESEVGRGATFWVELPGEGETLRDER
jgi:signal transduction histidine kinase